MNGTKSPNGEANYDASVSPRKIKEKFVSNIFANDSTDGGFAHTPNARSKIEGNSYAKIFGQGHQVETNGHARNGLTITNGNGFSSDQSDGIRTPSSSGSITPNGDRRVDGSAYRNPVTGEGITQRLTPSSCSRITKGNLTFDDAPFNGIDTPVTPSRRVPPGGFSSKLW